MKVICECGKKKQYFTIGAGGFFICFNCEPEAYRIQRKIVKEIAESRRSGKRLVKIL